MNLPLTRVCEPDLSTSLVVGSPTAAAAAYHKRIGMPSVDAIPFYEDVSVALFHSIMTVASSDVCEPTTTDGEAQVHSLPLTIFNSIFFIKRVRWSGRGGIRAAIGANARPSPPSGRQHPPQRHPMALRILVSNFVRKRCNVP